MENRFFLILLFLSLCIRYTDLNKMREEKKEVKWRGNLIKTGKACELRPPLMELYLYINVTKI